MELITTFNDYELPMVEAWEENQPTRIVSSEIARKHGVVVDQQSILGPRTITVSGKVFLATYALCRNLFDEMAHNLNVGRARFRLDDERFIYATKDSLNKRYIQSMQGCAIEYQITFLCDDPFWYSENLTEQIATLTGSTQTVTVSPSGLESTPVVLSIAPSSTMTKIRFINNNSLSQVWLQYDGSVTPGNALVLDGYNKTCVNGGINELGFSTGDFFELLGAQNNPLIISGIGCAGELTITYRNRWL